MQGLQILQQKNRVLLESFCDICKRPDDDCEACEKERLADYLISHGVVVLPCKVGDTVYTTYHCSLSVYRVTELIINDFLWAKLYNPDYSRKYETALVCLDFSFNEFVFLTREEAEKALNDMQKHETKCNDMKQGDKI